MSWGYNPFTKRLDKTLSDAEVTAMVSDTYVELAGDTMTGALTITPVSGTTALTANLDVVIKAGQKLILDGA